MWIVAHGVESDAATLAWEKVDAAQCYEVQLKVGDGADDDFKTVSDKLSSTMVDTVGTVDTVQTSCTDGGLKICSSPGSRRRWPSWKFDLETWQFAIRIKKPSEEKSSKVIAKINLLHTSILKKDIGLVKLILNLAQLSPSFSYFPELSYIISLQLSIS